MDEAKLTALFDVKGDNKKDIKLQVLKILVKTSIFNSFEKLEQEDFEALMLKMLNNYYTEKELIKLKGINSDDFIGIVIEGIIEKQDISKSITDFSKCCVEEFKAFVTESLKKEDNNLSCKITVGVPIDE